MHDGPAVGAPAAGSDLRAALWTALVLAVGLGLRGYAITGEMSADATVYAQNAYNLLHGTLTLRDDSWYTHRLPVFAPVALAYAAWGVNAFSTHLWPLALSLAQLGLTMWLGRRLLGNAAGILAGALLAFLPLDAMQAGNLLPDGTMATLLTAAAAFWILGRDHRGRRSRLLMFLSGLSLALSAVTRVYSIVLVVLYIGDSILRRRPRTDLLWAGLGVLAVCLPMAWLYRSATGDAFYPLRVVADAYGSRLAPQGTHWRFYPSLLWHPETETGFYPLLFAAAIAFSLARPDRPRLLLLFWGLPLLLYLEFGPMSLHAYVPIFKRTRFLTPLGAPFSLLAASMLCAAWSWLGGRARRVEAGRPGRTLAVAAAAVAILVGLADSLYVLRRDHVTRAAACAGTRAAVALLRSEPRLPIFVDHWWTACRLSYYFGFREGADFFRGADDRTRMARGRDLGATRFRYLAWYADPDSLPAGFIVLDDKVLEAVRKADVASSGPFFPGEVPAYGYRPPASWTLVRRIGSWRILLHRLRPAPHELTPPGPLSTSKSELPCVGSSRPL